MDHLVIVVYRVLATGFPKSDRMNNGITIAHMTTLGKSVARTLQTAIHIKHNLCFGHMMARAIMPPKKDSE